MAKEWPIPRSTWWPDGRRPPLLSSSSLRTTGPVRCSSSSLNLCTTLRLLLIRIKFGKVSFAHYTHSPLMFTIYKGTPIWSTFDTHTLTGTSTPPTLRSIPIWDEQQMHSIWFPNDLLLLIRLTPSSSSSFSLSDF